MDDAPVPPTLADVQSYGVDVFCWCHRCSHHAVLPVAVLIAHCGPGLPFPMVHGLLALAALAPRVQEAGCAVRHALNRAISRAKQ